MRIEDIDHVSERFRISNEEKAVLRQASKILVKKYQQLDNLPVTDSPLLIGQVFLPRLAMLDHERFVVACLDSALRITQTFEYKGDDTHVYIPVKAVIKSILTVDCSGVVLLHNHPTGQDIFSEEDELVTVEIYKLLSILDIDLLDHILIAGPKIISMVDKQQGPFSEKPLCSVKCKSM